jgi:hypothetical protein
MRCSKCGFENPDGMKFCGQCTHSLALTCPKCRFENPPGFKFCGQCTEPLAASEAKVGSPLRMGEAVANAAAVDGERKTITALFADIKGSTELMRDLDPEEARAIIDPALKVMIDVSIATTVTSCNRLATASSRCLARRSRMRIIRNARCTPRSRRATSCAHEVRTCGCRAVRESRCASALTPAKW